MSAANLPLQAARLGIMSAGLWGRAESVRTLARSLTEAVAPLAYDGIAGLLAGIVPRQAPIGTHRGHVSSNAATEFDVIA